MRGACAIAVIVAAASLPAWQNPAAPKSGLDPASFDRSVRPQDDLYRHVNGGWLARTEIPPERSSYAAFIELVDKVDADILAIVEELQALPHRRQ